MRPYTKVENERNLVRDMSTNAILETDIGKLRRHRAVVSAMQQKDKDIEMLKSEMELLKQFVLESLGGK